MVWPAAVLLPLISIKFGQAYVNSFHIKQCRLGLLKQRLDVGRSRWRGVPPANE